MIYYKLKYISEQEIAENLQKSLLRLPKWRREYALSFRFDEDRFLCAEAYLAIVDIVSQHYDVKDSPVFSYGPNGKPYLKEYKNIHINISHCRNAILCAASDEPVGVDIESVQFEDNLAKFVLSNKEYNAVVSSQSPSISFTELWTKKESKLKLYGTGISDNLKEVLHENDTNYELFYENNGKYVSCIAYAKENRNHNKHDSCSLLKVD